MCVCGCVVTSGEFKTRHSRTELPGIGFQINTIICDSIRKNFINGFDDQ